MIKKIILILLFSVIVVSCGKKGDPEYKGSNGSIDSVKII
tara:strand:- start:650 stop:769 length:120 start_codon:yes stop_codon:yes gene_type:complete